MPPELRVFLARADSEEWKLFPIAGEKKKVSVLLFEFESAGTSEVLDAGYGELICGVPEMCF